ncbi:MAG TPA: hypothetical protein VK140_15340 [Ktedonobacteraceae bacterium]|nr:hypothetical protein [Ktedonobacteraceae bacterium]
MIADELLVVDADAPLWRAARPLLDVALRLEQNDDSYTWHGWNKAQINNFLKNLPSRCSLVIGVWETLSEEGTALEHETLSLGVACEVVEGEVCSIRTFEALTASGLKPVIQLEPGIDDALEIMRIVRTQVAPVAWALFIDKAAWNEWLFASLDEGGAIDKGALLAAFARQGRCVVMGTQTAHHRHNELPDELPDELPGTLCNRNPL